MSPEEIKQARRELGLSLVEMGTLLGYTGANVRSMMDDLETGRRPVREPQRRLVEAYLSGYRPSDFPEKE